MYTYPAVGNSAFACGREKKNRSAIVKLFSRLIAVVVTVSCLAVQGKAQTSSGTISGHVVDQTGGVVVNAEVRLVNQQTGVLVTTQVRPNGEIGRASCRERV